MKRFVTYDKETGRAEVIIYHRGKKYRGVAKPCEEDQGIKSMYVGTSIADLKATLLMQKGRRKELAKQCATAYKKFIELSCRLSYRAEKERAAAQELEDYLKSKAKIADMIRNKK